jgi:hypothetical protein
VESFSASRRMATICSAVIVSWPSFLPIDNILAGLVFGGEGHERDYTAKAGGAGPPSAFKPDPDNHRIRLAPGGLRFCLGMEIDIRNSSAVWIVVTRQRGWPPFLGRAGSFKPAHSMWTRHLDGSYASRPLNLSFMVAVSKKFGRDSHLIFG